MSTRPSSFILDASSLARARVLVVGDVMLDRYWFGEVSRISPEAPVPVVHVQRSEERPGGAANVARNIAALGGRADLLSVVGKDEAGATLAALLGREGVGARLHQDEDIATTVKLRVIGRQQQLLRIDFENPPSHEVLLSKLKDFQEMVAETGGGAEEFRKAPAELPDMQTTIVDRRRLTARLGGQEINVVPEAAEGRCQPVDGPARAAVPFLEARNDMRDSHHANAPPRHNGTKVQRARRRMPSLRSGVLKLINRPKRRPVSLR